MALFQPVNVTLALSELSIEEADDRWYGVEPYIVPVFYKVDGERYRATLRLFNSFQPREGTAEAEAGTVQFAVDTLDDAGEEIEEDNPLTYVPPGGYQLRGDDLEAGDSVNVSDISFTTDLIPIPFTIDVFGLDVDILEGLRGLTVEDEGDVQSALNTIYRSLNSLIGELFGLDERLETCPAADIGASDFINNIEAQFKCMIPGTVGGVFLCMENDEFWAVHRRQVALSLRDEIASTLNDTVNAIALTNPIPDPDYWTDEEAIAENVASDLTWPVLINAGVSLGSLVLGVLTLNPLFAIYGLITSIGWAAGGPDDVISQTTFVVDHSMLGDPNALSFDAEITGDGNTWRLRGGLTINT